MKRPIKNRILRFICLLAVSVMLTVSLCIPAFCGVNLERKDCSIYVTPTSVEVHHIVVTGAEFTIYKVGNIYVEGANVKYKLTDAFAPSGLSLTEIESEDLAEQLAKYAVENKIEGEKAIAARDGTVRFEDLDTGLYLLVQTATHPAYLPVCPFLVSVPMTADNGKDWLYQIEASPKAQKDPDYVPPPPFTEGDTTDITTEDSTGVTDNSTTDKDSSNQTDVTGVTGVTEPTTSKRPGGGIIPNLPNTGIFGLPLYVELGAGLMTFSFFIVLIALKKREKEDEQQKD